MVRLIEAAVIRRIAWLLLPFVDLGYFFNALDRFNVAIAALTMNKSLGFTAAEYGLGAGAFFWSYVLFRIPSNIILTKLGARRWLSTIRLASEGDPTMPSARLAPNITRRALTGCVIA